MAKVEVRKLTGYNPCHLCVHSLAVPPERADFSVCKQLCSNRSEFSPMLMAPCVYCAFDKNGTDCLRVEGGSAKCKSYLWWQEVRKIFNGDTSNFIKRKE